jgi:hypothetical protein
MGDHSHNCDARVNYGYFIRSAMVAARRRVYCVWMPRTDENGRQLKALLDYLLDGENDAKDIYDAVPITGE